MKKVQDLSEDELKELRESYFDDFNCLLKYKYADEIPNEVLFKHYDGISFVEEDFFCNL